MLESLLTKENVTLALVSALLVWRIVDAILRQKKKREYELQKLALEITKLVVPPDDFHRGTFFSYYLVYLDALERGARPSHRGRFRAMQDLERRIVSNVEQMDSILLNLNAVEERLRSGYRVTIEDLFHRNLTWGRWWDETKMMLRHPFRKRTHIQA